MFFKGISKVSVDAKGRFALPKQRREQIGSTGSNTVVATAGPDECLLIFPLSQWHEIEPKLVALPNTHPAIRAYQRMYLGYATEIELDGSGRLLLPTELREHAGIERKAVLLGQGNKLELWAGETFKETSPQWAEQIETLDPTVVPESLATLSI